MSYHVFGVLHLDPDRLSVEEFAREGVQNAADRGLSVHLGGPGLRSGLVGSVLEDLELEGRELIPYLVLANPVHRDSDHFLFEGDADRVEHDLNRPAIAALSAWFTELRRGPVSAIDFVVTDSEDEDLESSTIETVELLAALEEQLEIDGLVPAHFRM
jgi:hypothetical protein